MKSKILALIALLAVVFVSNAQETQRFVVKVGDFTNLSVVDNINVEYRCNPDSTGLAVFSSLPQMANQMIFSNNNKGKLSISVGSDSVYSKKLPTVVVYSKYLSQAENFGDSTLCVKNVATTPYIKFKLIKNGALKVESVEATTVEVEILTGKGRVDVKGKCTDLKVKNTGSAVVNTEELDATNVSCRILGIGKVYCRVNGGKLSISGSGSGKVYYRGTPQEVKTFQLGTLKAINLEAEAEK